MRRKLNINFDKLEGEEKQRNQVKSEPRNENVSFFKELGLDSDRDDQKTQDDDIVFPFFSVIRGLLYVYGDHNKPDQDVITHVHLQIQEVVSGIFSKEIIYSLIKKSKKLVIPEYKSDIYNFSDQDDNNHTQGQQPTILSQNQTKFKRILAKYLQFVFSDFSSAYTRIQQNLTQVKKKCLIQEDIQENMNNSLYKQAIKKKIKETKEKLKHTNKTSQQYDTDTEESIFNEQSANNAVESHYEEQGDSSPPEISSEQSCQEKQQDSQLQQQPKEIQFWDLFMKNRIDLMNLEEFDKFMSLRSKTFASQKKRFQELLDPNNLGNAFQESIKSQTRFLNYCFCRIIRKIVIQCYVSSQAHDNFKIHKENAIKHGYQVIRKYSERAKKYAFTRQKVQKMAYMSFQKEFDSEGYGALFNSKQKIKIVRKENFEIAKDQQEVTQDRIKEVWKKMKTSRNMWVDRVFAERYLQNTILKKAKKKNPNSYFKFLWQNYQQMNVSYEVFKTKMPYLFKQWFIGIGRSDFQM